jgi:sarcosine/dimethylglycine N-methyltransferase
MESTLWTNLEVDDWKTSITGDDSIFGSLYDATFSKVLKAVKDHGYDAVVDFGCGCGEVIGKLSKQSDVRCVGLDINPQFISYCKHTYTKAEFHECNLLEVDEFWKKVGLDQAKKPLVICCNNTLSIIPLAIRGSVVSSMIALAGEDGKCLVTLWDGRFFSHAVIAYYQKNPNLCGAFSIADDVDFEKRHLECPSGYCTTWHVAEEVVRMIQSFDVNDVYYRRKTSSSVLAKDNYVENVDIGIFVWLNGEARNTAKDYYDSEDAQQFYSLVWGEATIHIGRHDLLDKELSELDNAEAIPASDRILRAQQIHENLYIDKISKLMSGCSPFRVADMGCGFGGFLRDLTATGLVWRGYGYDISGEMISKCEQLTSEAKASQEYQDRITWGLESYLSTSLPNESVDLVFSMDAFLHVGDKLHEQVLAEAWRVLRPGGYMVFNDIMQRPDAVPEQMAPILKRIHLSALGSVDNYRHFASKQGFSNFTFEDMSDCLPRHYGTVKKVLLEKKASGVLDGMSETFLQGMTEGLTMWESTGERNLHWGIVTMQKTGHPSRSVM